MMTRTLMTSAMVLTALISASSLASCNDTISGPTARVDRTVNNFSKIEVADGFEVTVIKDNVESLTIEAPEDAIPHIVTSVLDGKLSIYVDDLLSVGFTPRRIIIHARDLRSVELSGGSRLTTVGTFQSPVFSLEASGGSIAELAIEAQRATMETSGGSILRLRGSVDVMQYSISGGGEAEAYDLATRETSVEASGGSALEVRVSERLSVQASGGSTIRYKGHPSVSSELSGGSRVIDAN